MKAFYQWNLLDQPLILDSEILDYFIKSQVVNLFMVAAISFILIFQRKSFLISLLFLLSFVSLIASSVNQIFLSMNFILSLIVIAAILFGYWKKILNTEPEIGNADKSIYLFSFFVIYFLCSILKLYAVTTPVPNQIPISHSDQIFYSLTSSLIDHYKLEITPPYANNIIVGSKQSFWFYHYFEIYLIILIKRISSLPYFYIYQFIIWPFFHALGVLVSIHILIKSFKLHTIVALVLVLSVLLTLRFNLIDEYLFSMLHISTKGNSFFQNYGNSHFLSYWSGLKHALSLISILPVIYFGLERRYLQLSIAFVFALAVTPVNAPILFVFLGSLFLYKHSLFPIIAKSSIVVILFAILWLSSSFKLGLLNTVNFVFENNYWAILPIALICMFNYRTISIPYRIGVVTWILFPFIFINHKILFNLFLLPNLILIGYFIWKEKIKVRLLFVLVATSLFCLSKIAAKVNFESAQIFNNYSQLIILLLLGAFLYAKEGFKISLFLASVVVFFICIIGLPAIFYDAKIPMRYEEYSKDIELDPSKLYKALSISEFAEPPYLFRSTLGDGIITKNNNFIYFAVGFEFIKPAVLTNLIKDLRILKDDYFFVNRNTLDPSSYFKFVDQGLVDIIMVEDKPQFQSHVAYYQSRAKTIVQEKNRGYSIFIFR